MMTAELLTVPDLWPNLPFKMALSKAEMAKAPFSFGLLETAANISTTVMPTVMLLPFTHLVSVVFPKRAIFLGIPNPAHHLWSPLSVQDQPNPKTRREKS